MQTVFDKLNALAGSILALCCYFFGKHWFLFAGFLALNLADWITGWIKSRLLGKENSQKGLNGVVKKLGYWIMIAVSFGMAAIFVEIGNIIQINLQVTTLLGWFVLASLVVNELRSILENFVEAGFKVPTILVKGLEVADRKLNKESKVESEI